MCVQISPRFVILGVCTVKARYALFEGVVCLGILVILIRIDSILSTFEMCYVIRQLSSQVKSSYTLLILKKEIST